MMLEGEFMQYEIIFGDKVTVRVLFGKWVGGEGSGQRRMPKPVTMGPEVRGGEGGGLDWGGSESESLVSICWEGRSGLGGGDSGSIGGYRDISRSWSGGDSGTSLGRGDRGSKSFG